MREKYRAQMEKILKNFEDSTESTVSYKKCIYL